MSVTQSCVSGRLFVLVPAQSGRVNGTTEPKLFLQGTSKLQWEAVIAAQTGRLSSPQLWLTAQGFTEDSQQFQPHAGAAHSVHGTQASNLKLDELCL